MVKLKLKRIYLASATVGILTSARHDFQVCTLELPDLGNATSISCIPAGLYKCRYIVSPSLGPCYEVMDVYGRTYIRIHKGNYTRQIEGCILVGLGLKDIDKDGVMDVTNSSDAMDKLDALGITEFLLEIS